MRLFLAVAMALLLGLAASDAQEKKLLQTKGWGSLSGKVTDARTRKPIADAVVFLKLPTEAYFPIHDDDKKRKDLVIQIPAGGPFDFRMLTLYPQYFDGEKEVATGQNLVLAGDSLQNHVIQFDAGVKFRRFVPAGGEIKEALKPKALPFQMESIYYNEMRTWVYVFDHPYFGVANKDGYFTIARVPAGAEVILNGWQEDRGWLLTREGKKITFKEGKNAFDLEFEKKPTPKTPRAH